MGKNDEEFKEMPQEQLKKLADEAVAGKTTTPDEDIKSVLLRLKCHKCGQMLQSTTAYVYGQEFISRRCWRCGTEWTITIRCYRHDDGSGFTYSLEWEERCQQPESSSSE